LNCLEAKLDSRLPANVETIFTGQCRPVEPLVPRFNRFSIQTDPINLIVIDKIDFFRYSRSFQAKSIVGAVTDSAKIRQLIKHPTVNNLRPIPTPRYKAEDSTLKSVVG